MLTHVFVQKTCRLSDLNSGLNLVACKDPYLDSGFFKRDYCRCNVILKSVLDRSRTYKCHICLYLRTDIENFILSLSAKLILRLSKFD